MRSPAPLLVRMRVTVHGAVQGVGFRPFVYRLAGAFGVNGWVCNASNGVIIEIEGAENETRSFLAALTAQKPDHAAISAIQTSYLDPIGYNGFEIQESIDSGKTTVIHPDLATCSECVQEIFDPANRRFQYAFTNCTHCGPRFSIVRGIPYDRRNTTMNSFVMCTTCQKEYDDPRNRRFHAQPNACPACGPQLALWDASGHELAIRHDALHLAASRIKEGQIVAVKGIGGFQLLADARSDRAIGVLRQRKHREEKPFAVMFRTLSEIETTCDVCDAEQRLLTSAQAPIVILKRRATSNLPENIAPGNPNLGAMLPHSPLHHLLMHEIKTPLICTSGNISNEPICIDEREALKRLSGIADAFLIHNRPIARPIDDSVTRVMAGREMLVRRARGYAPLPVPVQQPLPNVLAVGGHLKNSIAICVEQNVFMSQHIGDLGTTESLDAFKHATADVQALYENNPAVIACDLHPDYASTVFAKKLSAPLVPVQHHYAHALACMAENSVATPALAIIWDGTGLGLDGTIWGGEFLTISEKSFTRAAHFRTFPLPGGDKAIAEPRRSALAVLYEIFGDNLFDSGIHLLAGIKPGDFPVLRTMLARAIQSPRTSSIGRLFDAAAVLMNVKRDSTFEGQAAMALEFVADPMETDAAYTIALRADAKTGGPILLDWEPMFREILCDLKTQLAPRIMSAKFHNALATACMDAARRIGLDNIVLSGGCFQNKRLLELIVSKLSAAGYSVHWHHCVPPNDGGLALGQIIAAAREFGGQSTCALPSRD